MAKTVKVRTLKVDGRKEVPHVEGLTVAQALEKAKAEVPSGGTVTVNHVPVTDLNTAVAEGATIVVTPPVENGR